jgi:NAD(P)-dependent dehydrogenase (short-subunit alcohol dehydrogenase family)
MNNLTKSLSKAYASEGILVNTVSPAFIMTPLVTEMLQKIAKEQGASPKEVQAQFLEKNRPHIAPLDQSHRRTRETAPAERASCSLMFRTEV